MRDIKFRAWDKETKKWIEDFDISSDGVVMWTDLQGDKQDIYDNAILMQFTGLLDKNGKEIYESDLIQAGQMIYQIAWYGMEGRLMPFTAEAINTNQYIASSGVPIRDWNWLDMGKGIYYHDIRKSVEVEVIGNIYENPELLKETQK